MLLAAIGLLLLALFIPAPLFGLMAAMLLLLIAPLFLLMSATPPLTVSAQGLYIQPLIWQARHIAWDEIAAIQRYPLLPTANQEVVRRALAGRKNYQAAEGLMLIVPGLPLPYRIAGFFAGARGQAIIAVTNRTQQNYAQFVQQVERRAAHLLITEAFDT